MSLSGDSGDERNSPATPKATNQASKIPYVDGEEISEESEELKEKRRIIKEILEMQATLEALSGRVDSVREENLRLRSENQVLGQYIENLMQASQVFQAIPPSKAAAGAAGRGASSSSVGRSTNIRGTITATAVRNSKNASSGSK